MRVAYNAQLTESLFLSKRAKRVFYAGRAHPYPARHRNHCAGDRPHSEAETKVLVRVLDPETWMNITLS
jgi:hypothetical protein